MRGVHWLTGPLFILLVACGQGEKLPSTPGKDTITDWEFEVNPVIDKEHLTVQMSVTNQQKMEGTLDFSSGQMYEIVLDSDSGEEVYRFSTGRMFTMAIIHESFAPMETKEYTGTIPLKGISSGTYNLNVEITAMAVNGEELRDKSILQKEIQIKIPS